jgi:ribosomal 50S subunit-associated protein YjgA (DUF615 family)
MSGKPSDDPVVRQLIEQLREDLRAEGQRLIREAVQELPTADRQKYQKGKRAAERLFGGEAA